MSTQLNVEFDSRNLNRNEEIIFTFRPYKKAFMLRNLIVGGGIPFPVVLLWAVVDFGVLFGVPLSSGDYWLFGILIPFIGVHGATIWIYLYGVISNAKDYYICGHIMTNERMLTRTSRKEPFKEFYYKDIQSLSILSGNKKIATLNITTNDGNNKFHSLIREDVEKAIDIYQEWREFKKNQELNSKFKTKCDSCGGRVENGRCVYCGSRATLVNEEEITVTSNRKSGKRK